MQCFQLSPPPVSCAVSSVTQRREDQLAMHVALLSMYRYIEMQQLMKNNLGTLICIK